MPASFVPPKGAIPAEMMASLMPTTPFVLEEGPGGVSTSTNDRGRSVADFVANATIA